MSRPQTFIGAGCLGLGALMAAGATSISSEAGYNGVGPNFLPWVLAVALLCCGLWLMWEALTGGFRQMAEPSGDEQGHWRGFAWVSAGLLANAGLITSLGFILSCALCYALAARGFRSAEGQSPGLTRALRDYGVGALIAAPVYWLFSKGLAINLPGLTQTGWL